MQNTDHIWDIVDNRRETYAAFSDRVFDTPEVAYTEFRSSDEHAAMLEPRAFASRAASRAFPPRWWARRATRAR